MLGYISHRESFFQCASMSFSIRPKQYHKIAVCLYISESQSRWPFKPAAQCDIAFTCLKQFNKEDVIIEQLILRHNVDSYIVKFCSSKWKKSN